MNQSLIATDEQPFSDLVQSIKEEHCNLNESIKSKATSFYTMDNYSSLRNEDFILNYEVIRQNQNTSNQNQLLKIENTSFSKHDSSAYCVIVVMKQNSIKTRIQQHLQKVLKPLCKFGFEIKYLDQTESEELIPQSNELKLFIEKNQFDCRFVIFAEEFQETLLKIIEDFPFIYCCSKTSVVQEHVLEGLKLHQSFCYIDLTYSIIRQTIPTVLSLLQDIIYTNIEIKMQNSAVIYPLQVACNSNLKNKEFTYSLPYVTANNFFYLPLQSDKIDITDGYTDTHQDYKYKQARQQEIEEYYFIFNQLKYCHQQLTLQDLFYSIKSEEQFYSVNSLILRDQVQQFNSFKVKNLKENEKLNKICLIIERICSSQQPTNEKLAEYYSLRQCLLYRMRNLYFIHQF